MVTKKNAKNPSWNPANKASGSKGDLKVDNVILEAWKQAHGKPSLKLSKSAKKNFKEPVKTLSDGKYTYAKAAKLSKAKTEKLGSKAIYKYVNKHVVKNVKLYWHETARLAGF